MKIKIILTVFILISLNMFSQSIYTLLLNEIGFVKPTKNGLRCPDCGYELYDSSPNLMLTSNPPQLNVHCTNCGFTGYRYFDKSLNTEYEIYNLPLAITKPVDSLAFSSKFSSIGNIFVEIPYYPPNITITNSNGEIFNINFKDTLNVSGNMPISEGARRFVEWINTEYNFYVDSIKLENKKLKEKIKLLEK